MNNLSWLLYLADVSENLVEMVHTYFVLVLILSPLPIAIIGMLVSTEVATYRSVKKHIPVKSLVTSLLLSLIVLGFVPSKTTIYLIAASEIGESVLHTEQAQQVAEYLETLLESHEEE